MKVLMVGNHESVYGGITSVIKQLLDYDWDKDNIKMYYIPTYKGGTIIKKILYFMLGYIRILKFIRSEKPDVIHIHMSHSGCFMRANIIHKLCIRYNIPDVIHLHGSEFKKFYYNSSNKLKNKIVSFLQECSTVIVLGEEWRKFISMIAPNTNIATLNNTVKIPEQKVTKKEEGISVLYLGVLVERKGVYDLLQVIKRLAKDRILDVNSVVFRVGGVGSEESKLKKYVIENNLENYIQFLGWVSGEEKKIELENNDIFVLPSYNEGLPIAILEAISYGMPIISTSVGSVTEAVINEYNGFVNNPGDLDAMYTSLKKILSDPLLLKSMSKNSRKIAIEKFDEKYYFEKIQNIYKVYISIS